MKLLLACDCHGPNEILSFYYWKSEWYNLSVWFHLNVCGMKLTFSQALLSVYDKTDLLDLAKGLAGAGVRLLGSGGTAKKIREAGISIQ